MSHNKSPVAEHLARVAILVVVLAGLQQTALAEARLTFISSSLEDEVGHLTEGEHNKIKTVAGQLKSGLVQQAEKSESVSRAAKPTEAALVFDVPLEGLGEIPFVKELGSLLLPHLKEVVNTFNGVGKTGPKDGAGKQNEVQKESSKKETESGLGNLLADAGKAIFGSKSNGSDGLLNDDTLRIPQFLKELSSSLPLPVGNIVSAVGKIIDNVKPLNTINQVSGGLAKGARSANEQTIDLNRLLEHMPAGESRDQVTKMFKAICALLEEGVFLSNKKQGQEKPSQQQQRQQQQQHQVVEEDIFF